MRSDYQRAEMQIPAALRWVLRTVEGLWGEVRREEPERGRGSTHGGNGA